MSVRVDFVCFSLQRLPESILCYIRFEFEAFRTYYLVQFQIPFVLVVS